jgi:hypothetical protein
MAAMVEAEACTTVEKAATAVACRLAAPAEAKGAEEEACRLAWVAAGEAYRLAAEAGCM